MTVPARGAQGEMKNIAEVPEAELERLQNCEPRFRELLAQKKYRILNKIPQDCKPAAQQVNEARAESDALRAENEALKAKLAALEDAQGKVESAQEATTAEDAGGTPTQAEATPAKKGKKK